jgi:hypothetical protein
MGKIYITISTANKMRFLLSQYLLSLRKNVKNAKRQSPESLVTFLRKVIIITVGSAFNTEQEMYLFLF